MHDEVVDPASAAFVLAATRSFATGRPCPAPPVDAGWVALAEDTGVLPVVLAALRGSGHPVGAAGAHRFAGAAQHLRAVAELRTLHRALGSTGLRWAVVKGPVLAQLVFTQPDCRTYDDLDVLVHPDDLGPVLAALVEHGFVVLDLNWPMVAASARGEIALLTPSGFVLDLHWHLVNDSVARADLRVDVRAMLARLEVHEIDGVPVPTLDALDTVCHVALHAVLSGGHALRWLLDLQQAVLRAGCPPAELRARAAEHGMGLVLDVALERSARWVDPGLDRFPSGQRPAWLRITSAVSRRYPPVRTSRGTRSGRTVFAATRGSTARSVHRLAGSLLTSARDRVPALDRSVPQSTLHRAAGSEADRDRWIAGAARTP